jgi:hypothetical protein
MPPVRENAAAQRKRIESHRQERESWLVEKRPDVLPSVAALVNTLEAHQTSRTWHDQKLCEAVIQLGFHGQACSECKFNLVPRAVSQCNALSLYNGAGQLPAVARRPPPATDERET